VSEVFWANPIPVPSVIGCPSIEKHHLEIVDVPFVSAWAKPTNVNSPETVEPEEGELQETVGLTSSAQDGCCMEDASIATTTAVIRLRGFLMTIPLWQHFRYLSLGLTNKQCYCLCSSLPSDGLTRIFKTLIPIGKYNCSCITINVQTLGHSLHCY
jgi:hypothetical protein